MFRVLGVYNFGKNTNVLKLHVKGVTYNERPKMRRDA